MTQRRHNHPAESFDPSQPQPRRFAWSIGGSALICACLALAGLLIYTPWARVPFDVQDFSELIPLLRPTRGFLESVAAMHDYYLAHGRAHAAAPVLIAANWELFHESPVGWRWSRAVLMFAGICAFVSLVRERGFSTVATVFGGALLMVNPGAAANWTRLSTEPLALVTLALLLKASIGYRSAPNWAGRAVLISAGVAVLLASKETMIALVPAVLVVSMCWDANGKFYLPVRQARSAVLVLTIGAIVAVWGYHLFSVLDGVGDDAYASTYSLRGPLFRNAVAFGTLIWLPVHATPNVIAWLFTVLVIGGASLHIRQGDAGERLHRVLAILFWLSLPIAGGIIYAPWQRWSYLYSVPFTLGVAALFTIALEGWLQTFYGRVAAWLAATVVVAAAMIWAANYHSFYDALRRANNRLVAELLTLPERHLIVGAAEVREWNSAANTLERQVHVDSPDHRFLSVGDRECREAAQGAMELNGPAVVVLYRYRCGAVANPSRSIIEPIYTFSSRWGDPADSLAIALLLRP